MHSEREFYTSTPGHNEMLINHITVDRHETINSPTAFPRLKKTYSITMPGTASL